MAWPEVTEAAGTPARWDLQGRQTVHNCKFNGVFGWQNNTNPHDIVHYDIYRCGQSAVRLGAYRQQYHTDDIVTQGCGMGLQIYASSGAGRYQQFTNFNEDFGGKSVNGIIVREHGLPFLGPCLVQGSWKGYTGKAVLIKESPAKLQGWYQFRARGNGAELLPADFDIQSIHPSSIIDIIHDDGHSYRYTTPAGWVAA
jgi:hypothetical protein